MSTINDLNTTLQNKIDLDEENIISTPLKKGNSGILNNKEIPSIEETVKHLQYNYEVLEIRRDYQGTLENLMRQQGKKIPKYLPFINLFLVGGGSSGGWIQDPVNEGTWHGSGYWGNTNFYYLNNIDLKTNINIKIGKGGISKPKIMKISSLNKNDYLPNLGGITKFSYNDNDFETPENSLKNTENFATGSALVCNPAYVSNHSLIIDKQIEFDIETEVKKKVCNLKNFEIYTPHNYKYVNSVGFVITKYEESQLIGTTAPGPHMLMQKYIVYSDIYANDISIYKQYLENIKYNFIRRPNYDILNGDYIVNQFGAVGEPPGKYSTKNSIDVVFFDGMDVSDIGMPGLPGSKSTYITGIDDKDNPIYSYQRGYCGKGGDGACFIYYPKEV